MYPSLCPRTASSRAGTACAAGRAAHDATRLGPRRVIEIAEMIDGGAQLLRGRRRGTPLLHGCRARQPARTAAISATKSTPQSTRRLRVLLRGGQSFAIELQGELQVCVLVPRERHGILPCIARRAVVLLARADRLEQSAQAEVAERNLRPRTCGSLRANASPRSTRFDAACRRRKSTARPSAGN